MEFLRNTDIFDDLYNSDFDIPLTVELLEKYGIDASAIETLMNNEVMGMTILDALAILDDNYKRTGIDIPSSCVQLLTIIQHVEEHYALIMYSPLHQKVQTVILHSGVTYVFKYSNKNVLTSVMIADNSEGVIDKDSIVVYLKYMAVMRPNDQLTLHSIIDTLADGTQDFDHTVDDNFVISEGTTSCYEDIAEQYKALVLAETPLTSEDALNIVITEKASLDICGMGMIKPILRERGYIGKTIKEIIKDEDENPYPINVGVMLQSAVMHLVNKCKFVTLDTENDLVVEFCMGNDTEDDPLVMIEMRYDEMGNVTALVNTSTGKCILLNIYTNGTNMLKSQALYAHTGARIAFTTTLFLDGKLVDVVTNNFVEKLDDDVDDDLTMGDDLPPPFMV